MGRDWWNDPAPPLTPGGSLLPTLGGQSLKAVRVKSDESGLEFYTPSDVGFANPMTTAGDLIVGGVSGAAARLAKGSNGQVLGMVSGAEAWATVATLLGYTPESTANKSTDTALGTSDTLYPSQKAVKAYVDANAGGAQLLQSATVTLTHAQIVAIPATPFQIVAAPGAGKVLLFMGGYAVFHSENDYDIPLSGSSIQQLMLGYTVSDYVTGYFGGASTPYFLQQSTGDHFISIVPYSATPGSGAFSGNIVTPTSLLSNVANKPLLLRDDDNNGGDPYTGGHANNTLAISVYYIVADL